MARSQLRAEAADHTLHVAARCGAVLAGAPSCWTCPCAPSDLFMLPGLVPLLPGALSFLHEGQLVSRLGQLSSFHPALPRNPSLGPSSMSFALIAPKHLLGPLLHPVKDPRHGCPRWLDTMSRFPLEVGLPLDALRLVTLLVYERCLVGDWFSPAIHVIGITCSRS